MGKGTLVLKLGGELLEQPQDLARVARGIVALAKQGPLVVVHGGGREIDAALALAGIPKQQVDGLRVTDARTLDVVVSVLAGSINTRLVAAVRAVGGRPVGLTGADASVATVRRARPITVARLMIRSALRSTSARAKPLWSPSMAFRTSRGRLTPRRFTTTSAAAPITTARRWGRR